MSTHHAIFLIPSIHRSYSCGETRVKLDLLLITSTGSIARLQCRPQPCFPLHYACMGGHQLFQQCHLQPCSNFKSNVFASQCSRVCMRPLHCVHEWLKPAILWRLSLSNTVTRGKEWWEENGSELEQEECTSDSRRHWITPYLALSSGMANPTDCGHNTETTNNFINSFILNLLLNPRKKFWYSAAYKLLLCECIILVNNQGYNNYGGIIFKHYSKNNAFHYFWYIFL